MQAGHNGSLPRAALAALVIVALLVLISIFSASFLAGAALVCGIVLPALVFLLLSRLRGEGSASSLRLPTIVVSAILVALVALAAVILAFPRRSFQSAVTATVRAYTVTIQPRQAGIFTINEEADVELETFDVFTTTQTIPVSRVHSARTVTATGKGWLLQEVSFSPLVEVRVSLPDGTQVKPLLLADFGARLSARLQDMARGSTYAVKYAQNLASSPYVDTETITWSVPDLERSITFAYIPPPWHNLRPLLAPFLSLSSLSQWLVGILGMVGGTVFGAFVQPALVAFLRDRLIPWLVRQLKRRKPPAPGAAST